MYARGNEILEIEYNGRIFREQKIIMTAFESYYRDLFACREPKAPGYEDDFLAEMPTLGKEETNLLEMNISMEEIERAIEELSSGKSPGPDGITAAFYKAFKTDMATALHEVFSEALERGTLPPSFNRAHTVLIPKGKEKYMLRKVTGYRPITLTNVDYKVFMKVLAARLQGVIQKLVGPHQTCGIRGRKIFTNIHTARSILEYCDSALLKVAMLQIDLAKAFDMVPHSVLFLLINYVGLGSIICKGIKMAYQSSCTNLIVNGELSQRIQVLSSVRQGCPLSPLLFALFLEPLCRKIVNSTEIRGLRYSPVKYVF